MKPCVDCKQPTGVAVAGLGWICGPCEIKRSGMK